VLGYEPMQITRIFSGESFLLNGLGVVIGLAGGVGLSYLLALAYNTELYRFPVVILPERFLHTTLLMVLFISLAQLIIARMVFKVPWLEVLKVKE
jgi:putative ABC transport system permease protein